MLETHSNIFKTKNPVPKKLERSSIVRQFSSNHHKIFLHKRKAHQTMPNDFQRFRERNFFFRHFFVYYLWYTSMFNTQTLFLFGFFLNERIMLRNWLASTFIKHFVFKLIYLGYFIQTLSLSLSIFFFRHTIKCLHWSTGYFGLFFSFKFCISFISFLGEASCVSTNVYFRICFVLNIVIFFFNF